MDLSQKNSFESERIRDLDAYYILDSEPELSFDQLTYLASSVCKTPIALLSFIDTDRQWFKSTFGLELHELPRHLSPCNKVISINDLYEIRDCNDVHCPYTEFMKSSGFHFYSGVPVRSKEGRPLGTLCVLDYVPRSLTPEQIKTLKVIAGQAVDVLEIRKRYRENLQCLREVSEASAKSDKYIQDIAHKATLRGMAELSSGLIYRIRPLVMSMMNASDNIDLIKTSGESILTVFDNLEKFIIAEKEKWMRPLELNDVIKKMLSFLDHKIKKNCINVTLSMDQEIRCIGNISQISEALVALLNNSIESLIHSKQKDIHIVLKEENHFGAIYVEDSGRGIPENVRPFIFEPFFTTKGIQGLGTGLSLAQALMQNHGGDVELVRPSNPTTFVMKIPLP